MTTLIYAVAVLLIVVNVVVNVSVLRSSAYSGTQKTLQSLVIWLLPFLGVLAVWAFLGQLSREQETRPDHFPDRIGGGDGYSQGPSFGSDAGGGDGGGGGGGDGA